MAAGGPIARLKFALDHVEPKVTRRPDVPRDLRRDRLPLVIEIAMCCTNTHFYEFRVRDVG